MSQRYDEELRRTRERFGSLKTQLALNEAIADVSGVTPFDAERIIAQLFKHKDDFKHIDKPKDARAAMVAWATRQARLIVQFHSFLPELNLVDNVASLVLIRLPDYQGAEDHDALKSWAVETANREAFYLSSLTDLVTEHRAAVRAGVREVLAGCIGLGLDSRVGRPVDDGPWSMTVDEIESNVWMDVARNLDNVLNSNAPIGALLNRKGYWTARSWKTNRLRERNELNDKFFIGIDGIETFVANENEETEPSDAAEGFIDLHSLHNPIIIRELPWTQAELERELRRAGPFRADGFDLAKPLPVAA